MGFSYFFVIGKDILFSQLANTALAKHLNIMKLAKYKEKKKSGNVEIPGEVDVGHPSQELQ